MNLYLKGFVTKWDISIFLRFSFYKLKQYIIIIPTIDNFCFIAYVKNVDTKGNQRS